MKKQKTYPQERVDIAQLNRVMRHRLRNLCCGMKMAVKRISDHTKDSYPQFTDNFTVMSNEFDNLMECTERMDLLFDYLPEELQENFATHPTEAAKIAVEAIAKAVTLVIHFLGLENY